MLQHERIQLQLKHPFTIARGSTTVKDNLYVTIGDGRGEAAPTGYYGETVENTEAFFGKATPLIAGDLFRIDSLMRLIDAISPGNGSAKAAIDAALHDNAARQLGIPVYRMLGLDRPAGMVTSFTIGIDKPDVMVGKLKEAPGFEVYKVKVGVPGDLEMVAAIRENTSARIRVDANSGWDKYQAVEKIRELERFDIEFVEQPVAMGDTEALRHVRSRVNIPIFADEGLMKSEDVIRHKDCVDGVNIKLVKCGGIREALRMIHTARACGMKIMLGCMIESSVGIAAALQLSTLVDYLDLDGHLLIADDPYEGISLRDGKLSLSERPGLGVEKKAT